MSFVRFSFFFITQYLITRKDAKPYILCAKFYSIAILIIQPVVPRYSWPSFQYYRVEARARNYRASQLLGQARPTSHHAIRHLPQIGDRFITDTIPHDPIRRVGCGTEDSSTRRLPLWRVPNMVGKTLLNRCGVSPAIACRSRPAVTTFSLASTHKHVALT